jgi:hypothetical protein
MGNMRGSSLLRGLTLRTVLWVLLAALLLPAASMQTAASMQSSGRPALLVVLSVDQMRADYLSRYQPYYSGGLKWLYENGVVFENALHRHAITETGPGPFHDTDGPQPCAHRDCGQSVVRPGASGSGVLR